MKGALAQADRLWLGCALRPDVTVMDFRLPDRCGRDVMIAIRSEFPDARIIVLTSCEGDMHVLRALKAEARGYLLKSMPPRPWGRRFEPTRSGSLQQVAGGQRRDIAAKLFIAEEAVKAQMKHIMDKVRASDRAPSL